MDNEHIRILQSLLISVNNVVRNSYNYSLTGALPDEEMSVESLESLAPLCRASYPSRLGLCKQLRECLGGGGCLLWDIILCLGVGFECHIV